jgi:hypothetical protein
MVYEYKGQKIVTSFVTRTVLHCPIHLHLVTNSVSEPSRNWNDAIDDDEQNRKMGSFEENKGKIEHYKNVPLSSVGTIPRRIRRASCADGSFVTRTVLHCPIHLHLVTNSVSEPSRNWNDAIDDDDDEQNRKMGSFEENKGKIEHYKNVPLSSVGTFQYQGELGGHLVPMELLEQIGILGRPRTIMEELRTTVVNELD